MKEAKTLRKIRLFRNGLADLDPRLRLFSFPVLFTAVVLTPNHHVERFLAFGTFLVLMAVLARISLLFILKRFLFFLPLLVFLALSVLLFSVEGPAGAGAAFFHLLLKSFLVYLALVVFIMSTGFNRILEALNGMKAPGLATSLLSFTCRYSQLFAGEAERMRRAKESRTSKRMGALREVRLLSRLVSLLVFRALERSSRVFAAMLSRGYTGKMRTIDFLKFGKADLAYGLIFPLFLAGVIVLL